MIKKSFIAVIAALVAVSAGSLVSAQTATTTTSGSVNVDAYISQLQILRQLRQGMSGDDVKLLQTILASQPDVYPEGLITGTYGPLTAKAVAKYQQKFGLSPVGRVGPQTLAKLNEVIKFSKEDGDDDHMIGSSTATSSMQRGRGDDRGDNKLCVKVPPGHLIAPGWQKTHGGENTMTVPTCQQLPPGIIGKLGGDRDHGTTTQSTTTQPVTALVISNVAATSTTASTTVINWNTQLFGTSKVVFGTTTPLTASSTVVSNNVFTVTHSISLSNLASSTIYYYQVSSANIYGNVTVSPVASFTTNAQ